MITVPFKDAWTGQADCKTCSLRSSVLFAGLTEEDFESIHKPINQFVLKPGEMLYREGDMGNKMFTIRSGLIKLAQNLPDGSQRIVRLVGTSDVTGLEAMLNDAYKHDATVLQTTEICCLPIDVINKLGSSNTSLHKELLKRWNSALNEADSWLTELSTGSAKQRVARLILKLINNNASHPFSLFSREDIGSMLGITTETASRTIADFKRRELIKEVSSNKFIGNIDVLQAET